MRRSSVCDEMAWAKKQGHGEWDMRLRSIEKVQAGVLGVSEVGEAVADLGRRRVVQS